MIYSTGMWRRVTETQLVWAIIAAMIAIDIAWARTAGIGLVPSLPVIVGFAVLSSIGLLYSTIRPKPRIAALAVAAAQLNAFTAAAAMLSYLTATSKFPLIDRNLAAGDVAIGIDWRALFNWMQQHPAIDRVLAVCYASGTAQVVILLTVLSVTRQFERVRELVWLFVLTLLIIILIAWVMPAEGAWAYYGVSHLTSGYYLPDFYALRAGTMSEIALAKVTGIIQFPSFHAALALILIFCSRGMLVLFPVSLALNILMIASTPVTGGHHITDVLAGLATVPLALSIFRWPRREVTAPLVVAVDPCVQDKV